MPRPLAEPVIRCCFSQKADSKNEAGSVGFSVEIKKKRIDYLVGIQAF